MNIENLPRYRDTGNQGEYIQLRGYPCVNSKCVFCEFPKDNSTRTDHMIEFNKSVIDRIHGRTGILEAYNFGSIFELPIPTLFYLREKIISRGIERLLTDSHWFYREGFQDMRDFFGIDVMIKIGLETFNNDIRERFMQKNMGYVTPEEVLKYTDSVNLLVGFNGQTREDIITDLKIIEGMFRFADVNVIDPRFTKPEFIDQELVNWFLETFRDLSEKFRVNYEVS